MKRGQAAMEFLLSYGWVLIIIFAGLLALIYFGILNPNENIPEACILFPGMACKDYRVTEAQITILVAYGGGVKLQNVSITIIGDDGCSGDTSNVVALFSSGSLEQFTINCTEKLTPKTAFRGELQITYTEFEGLTHNKKGQLYTKVEEL